MLDKYSHRRLSRLLRVSLLDSPGQLESIQEFLLVCFKLPLKYGSEN